MSFQEILSNNEGTYVLPIVSESGSKGHKISRFAKIEIFDAHSLTFRPTEGKRIHDMRKLILEKRSVEDLEQRAEELRKKTRAQNTLAAAEKRAQVQNMRDNNEAKRENDEKSLDRNREQAVKLEEMRKKEEAQRIEKIKAETKNMLQVEKTKRRISQAKECVGNENNANTGRTRSRKRDEEHIKAIEKGKEANAKHIEQANEERKKNEENIKYDEEKKENWHKKSLRTKPLRLPRSKLL